MHPEEGRMHMSGFLIAAIMPLNDVCDTYMRDALLTLKWYVPTDKLPSDYNMMSLDEQTAFKQGYLAQHSWYKHTMKKWGQLARVALDKNLSSASIRRTEKHMDELEYEFHDQYEEQIKPYVKALYWAIRNAMTKADYSAVLSDLVAKVECVEVLLGLTCGYFDEGCHTFHKLCHKDFSSTFASLKPMQAYKAWGKLVELIADRLTGKPINFNTDADIKIATSGMYEQIRNRKHCEVAEENALLECADKVVIPDSWRNRLKDKLTKQLNG